MKKNLLLFILLLTGVPLIAQQSQSDDPYDINYYYNKGDYYNAIKGMDALIARYAVKPEIYFYRGLSYYYLNDQLAARKDFLKAQELGYKEDKNFIRWHTSIDFRAKELSKHYIDVKLLDPKNGYRPVYGRKDSLQGALRPERNCYDVYFYDLTVKILPKSKSIEGSNQIYFKTTAETNKIQIDLTEKLKITSIVHKGKNLKFTREFNAIFIDLDETLKAGENHVITFNYKGKPRASSTPPWDGGFVWKKENKNWWIGVACEHFGASSWWPCKDHLTEKPDSMCINIQVPDGYEAVANGNLRSTDKIGDDYTNFKWFVSYPINSYCVTFYMGKFVNFNEVFTNDNGDYKIDYYVLPQSLDSAKHYYAQTKEIIRVYEKLYGEYPYKKDGAAMVEAPYAGMEHQSAIAIGNDYGLKKRRNYDEIGYDYLLVHETAHEWWGNTVTMGDMADAWLSEAFATYSEALFMEEKYGYYEYMNVVSKGMQSIENIWPMVGKRDVNDNTFLSSDIYHKGSAMLHCLRCTINDDTLFFQIIKGFYNARKFKISTTQDFIDYVNQSTGKDYTDLFKKFLYDAEPPILYYSYTLKDGAFEFYYRWGNVGKNFSMPFGIMLDDYKGVRLEGTSEYKTYRASDIDSFYIPNEIRTKKNAFLTNSFTYFWTSWVK